jgi:hypothetical protein
VKNDLHPLVIYGDSHDLARRQTAAAFRIGYGTFRQIVSGHTGVSWQRAEEWERVSGGEIEAADVMRWQERNRKSTEDAAA